MAIGDIPDFVRRLRAALPRRWFPDDSPVLVGMLTGFAAVWSNLFALLQYTIQQSRLATVSGVFLDLVAKDYFGTRIVRNAAEPDTHFRRRILAEILRPRATRAAIDQALFDLTGQHPVIFEPANATDTGGYNLGGIGYNTAGGWGSVLLPFQAFITAFRPAGGGIANVSGYGNIAFGITTTGGLGGYGVGAIEYADLELITGAITDADIYATVAAAMPIATIGWTRGLAAGDQSAPILSRPAMAFSRSVSTAQVSLSLIQGALMSGLGAARARGGLFVAAAAVNVGLAARSASATFGQLSAPLGVGVLAARGIARSTARAAALAGAGILFGRSAARISGKTTGLTGTTPLTGRGIARGTGDLLYVPGIVNLILAVRGVSTITGKATSDVKTALVARGQSRIFGVGAPTGTGAALLVARGTIRATAKLTPATRGTTLRSRSITAAKGLTSVTITQAAPTAPTGLTASNATPNTMVLTWTPSAGA